jgi:hypothetical protein
MVQLKMRPIFSRGNSVASISVAAPKPDDEDGDDSNEEEQVEREARNGGSPHQRPQLPRRTLLRRRRPVNAHVTIAENVTEHPAGEPLTEKELKAYFYSVSALTDSC